MTAKATTTTTTTKAPKKVAAPKVAPTPDTAVCPAGSHVMPVRSFPTEQRAKGVLTECRRCRDARYAAMKAAKASA